MIVANRGDLPMTADSESRQGDQRLAFNAEGGATSVLKKAIIAARWAIGSCKKRSRVGADSLSNV